MNFSLIASSTPLISYKFRNKQLTNKWNYHLEFFFIIVIGIFAIPSNLFLILFYIKKARIYKKLRNLNLNQARIANSFYTYILEMSSFDTMLVIYLILDASFKLAASMEKTVYESVYDVSNFTCKFFIYVVRISSAMSNYLVCLLLVNRYMLLLGTKVNDHSDQGYRICLNTKYLTLFLFCICTIANVFRLERLELNLRIKRDYGIQSEALLKSKILEMVSSANQYSLIVFSYKYKTM